MLFVECVCKSRDCLYGETSFVDCLTPPHDNLVILDLDDDHVFLEVCCCVPERIPCEGLVSHSPMSVLCVGEELWVADAFERKGLDDDDQLGVIPLVNGCFQHNHEVHHCSLHDVIVCWKCSFSRPVLSHSFEVEHERKNVRDVAFRRSLAVLG